MNPLGVLMIIIGVMLIIIGFKGKQDELLAAFTGEPTNAAQLINPPAPEGGADLGPLQGGTTGTPSTGTGPVMSA